ncbi:MAG: Grx4 family monothiol glutaredoxin [Deltaproteobacteria bacterium]|nr:Grx4 family monothiol glutaredoxin [Deltaproteobacteria bacterium]
MGLFDILGSQSKTSNSPKQGRDVQAEIKKIVESNAVVLFMKGVPQAPQCGFSSATVQVLNSYQIQFKGIDVLADGDIRDEIKKFSNWPTIPQLYVKGTFIGGCDIVTEMHERGQLKKLFEEKGLLK